MNATAILNDVAAQHAGEPPGDIRAPCPVCNKGPHDKAVNISVKGDGSVVVHCHRCGRSGAARAPERMNGHARAAPRSRPAEDATAIWNAGVEAGETLEHPYLMLKQVGAHGIRVKDDMLLVPLRRAAGELVGVQKIHADGHKRYVKGTTKIGAFHTIGELTDTIVVAEGYATAASIHEATGRTVAIAFDSGNLDHVAKALRARHPQMDIIMAADDDHRTAGNPGIASAVEAARAVDGRIAFPTWPDSIERANGTDFNDLRNAAGDEPVQRAVANARAPELPRDQPAANDPVTGDPDPLEYEFAHDLDDNADEADELVERFLTRGAMGVIYGDSNSGKTFLAIDIACAIARSVQWMGRNTEPGMVLYLATESPASVRRRLRAYQRHHGCKVQHFVIIKSPIDLYNDDSDTRRVIDLAHRLERKQGVKCELIVGDTLSRLCAGANENSGEDMSIVVRNVDRVRSECEAHFLLIHHTGKDAARGMRGWSGMRAATDTEIEVSVDADSGIYAAEITKQRDIAGKGDRIGFRLQVVEMGVGKWGKSITSCVVVDANAPAKHAAGKRPSEIAGAITEFLTVRGAGIKKSELVKHFDGRHVDSAVYREIRKMIAAGKLRECAGIVSLVQR